MSSLRRIRLIKGLRFLIDQWIKLIPKILDTSTAEARTCTRKYFKAASEFRGDLELIRRAIKASMLISRPIQAAIQEGAEIAAIEPRISKEINADFQGRRRIKRRIVSIFGI